MPKLPGISQKEAVRVFQKMGYRIARQSGHIVMSNGNPLTMGAIAKDAGLTPEEFKKLL